MRCHNGNVQVDRDAACPYVVMFLLVVAADRCGVLSQGRHAGGPRLDVSLWVSGDGGAGGIIRKCHGIWKKQHNCAIEQWPSRSHQTRSLLAVPANTFCRC